MGFTLKVTEDRMKGLKLGILRRIEQRGSAGLEARMRYVAHFMIGDDGEYLPEDAAMALLDDMPGSELGQWVEQVITGTQEAAAPKA